MRYWLFEKRVIEERGVEEMYGRIGGQVSGEEGTPSKRESGSSGYKRQEKKIGGNDDDT